MSSSMLWLVRHMHAALGAVDVLGDERIGGDAVALGWWRAMYRIRITAVTGAKTPSPCVYMSTLWLGHHMRGVHNCLT